MTFGSCEGTSGSGALNCDNLNIKDSEKKIGKMENEEVIIEISESEDEGQSQQSRSLLNDVPEVDEDDVIYISSSEEDDGYEIQVQNAKALMKAKQPLEVSASGYRPHFVSREKLNEGHPRCRGLTFKDIMHQTILEDKVIPDFNEQLIPRKVADKLRAGGHTLHRVADGGFTISSKRKNVKMYYSSFSTRFEPVLADQVLENYVQEYRKSLCLTHWKKRLLGRQEVSFVRKEIRQEGTLSMFPLFV